MNMYNMTYPGYGDEDDPLSNIPENNRTEFCEMYFKEAEEWISGNMTVDRENGHGRGNGLAIGGAVPETGIEKPGEVDGFDSAEGQQGVFFD